MTFWEAFFRTLRWRPRQALAGLYWHLTRRKVRARNRLRLGAAQVPNAYDYWVQNVETNHSLGDDASAVVEGWQKRPKFSVILHAPTDSAGDTERTIASVKSQFYPDWQLIITTACGDNDGLNASGDPRLTVLTNQRLDSGQELEAAIASATGDYLVPLRVGQLLSPMALFRFAEALQGKEQPVILYGDQDEIDAQGRRSRPWFKPQWDQEMFLAQDYLSDACAVDRRVAREVLPATKLVREAATFSLLLAASSAASGSVAHLPYVLSHMDPGKMRSNQAARVAAVERHVKPLGAKAMPGRFDTVKVEWPLPDVSPRVSILIPTRDKVHLLRACVDSVLRSTRYPDFELIIVDNGSIEPETHSYLSQIGTHPSVRVISYDRPYNYSAINNFAASHAAAPYLCLLNNDTEVMAQDWLTEMMRYAVRPETGAVGAQLLYDDGSIQHAGVIVGIGEAAGHAHRFERSDARGYFAQPHVAHVVSAVTAACLVVEKRKFDAVGGLDADGLPVAYNDVDLCLKLEQAGWRNIYVPHAVLLHHESKSRGLDSSPKNRDRYMRELAVLQERWGTKTYNDPRHNPNLDRNCETFIFRL